MESINHCPITRKKLKEILINNNAIHNVLIPEDGELMIMEQTSRSQQYKIGIIKMNKFKVDILTFGAHPDDVECAAAGIYYNY